MSKRKRRTFTTAQKASILRRHHLDRVPISQICEEEKIQPSLFYTWQRQVFANLERAVPTPPQKRSSAEKSVEKEMEKLRKRLAQKDHVIAVVSEEFVKLKKELGES